MYTDVMKCVKVTESWSDLFVTPDYTVQEFSSQNTRVGGSPSSPGGSFLDPGFERGSCTVAGDLPTELYQSQS